MEKSSSAPVPNRRACRRMGLRRSCELVLPGQSTRQATLMDVGVDGLAFLCIKPITPGTRCRISFELPLDERRVTVSATLKTVYSSYFPHLTGGNVART
jgi:hypothetical protein